MGELASFLLAAAAIVFVLALGFLFKSKRLRPLGWGLLLLLIALLGYFSPEARLEQQLQRARNAFGTAFLDGLNSFRMAGKSMQAPRINGKMIIVTDTHCPRISELHGLLPERISAKTPDEVSCVVFASFESREVPWARWKPRGAKVPEEVFEIVPSPAENPVVQSLKKHNPDLIVETPNAGSPTDPAAHSASAWP